MPERAVGMRALFMPRLGFLKKGDRARNAWTPIDLVKKIAEELGVSDKSLELAVRCLRKAREARLYSGKRRSSLAAAALYIACRQNRERVSQGKIAAAAGVTPMTVRLRYKEIAECLQIGLPPAVYPTYRRVKQPLEELEEYFMRSLRRAGLPLAAPHVAKTMHHFFPQDLWGVHIRLKMIDELVTRNRESLKVFRWDRCERQHLTCPCGECHFYTVAEREARPT